MVGSGRQRVACGYLAKIAMRRSAVAVPGGNRICQARTSHEALVRIPKLVRPANGMDLVGHRRRGFGARQQGEEAEGSSQRLLRQHERRPVVLAPHDTAEGVRDGGPDGDVDAVFRGLAVATRHQQTHAVVAAQVDRVIDRILRQVLVFAQSRVPGREIALERHVGRRRGQFALGDATRFGHRRAGDGGPALGADPRPTGPRSGRTRVRRDAEVGTAPGRATARRAS